MYQCPDSYCLPMRKVCDGVKDCPLGHDEMQCDNYTCPGLSVDQCYARVPFCQYNFIVICHDCLCFLVTGLFKCKGETRCIVQQDVCDGKVDCLKHREDEKYCETAGQHFTEIIN